MEDFQTLRDVPAFKAFFNEDDANDFAESLRAANNLLQNRTNIDISIKKEE